MNLDKVIPLPKRQQRHFAPLALSVIVASLFAPKLADGHSNSRIYMDIMAQGRNVRLKLRTRNIDLAPLLNVAQGVIPNSSLFRMQKAEIFSQLRAYIILVGEQGQLCNLKKEALRTKGNEIHVVLDYRCPYGPLRLNYDLLFDSDPAHKVYVSIRNGKKPKLELIKANRRSLELSSQTSWLKLLREFVSLGGEHILSGADHLLFVLVLLLAIPRSNGEVSVEKESERGQLKKVLVLITAFTLAHSLTLALAALRIVTLPPRLVESAIALSILYVALENLWRKSLSHRWWLVFAFGLMHGFGFAQILAQTGLPTEGHLLSLFAFNVGVELGQVLVVLLFFPILEILSEGGQGLRGALMSLGLAALLSVALWSFGANITTWATVIVLWLSLMLWIAHRWGYKAVRNLTSLIVAGLALVWLIERAILSADLI
jgi:hypothetical protein